MAGASENRVKSPTILIVDDVQQIGDLLREKLCSMGYSCYLAESAPDALTKLRERPFDVVLLDVKLPGKSGIDLLKDLKSSWPDSTVIVISAVLDLNTVDEAIRRGACDYVIKPFNLHEIVLSVERVLDYQHMQEVWRRTLGIRPRKRKLYHETHSSS